MDESREPGDGRGGVSSSTMIESSELADADGIGFCGEVTVTREPGTGKSSREPESTVPWASSAS